MTLGFSVHPWVGISGGYHLRCYRLFDGDLDDNLQTFPGLINILILLDGDVDISKAILYALHISPLPETIGRVGCVALI